MFHYVSIVNSISSSVPDFDYSGLMQNIGLGILALFTPLALFLFSDQKLTNLDKVVILNEVLRARYLSINILLVFVPQFFYDFGGIVRGFVFLSFIIGLYYIVRILIDCFYWFSALEGSENNFRNKCRNRYFEENKNWNQKKVIWSSTWEEEMEMWAEVDRFNKFILDVDALWSEENFILLKEYVRDFHENIHKRNLDSWHLFNRLWPSILHWNYKIYVIYKSLNDYDSSISEIKGLFNQLVNKIFLSGVTKSIAYLCFQELEKHVGDKPNDYLINNLFVTLPEVFFENIHSAEERHFIWDSYFPAEWKITSKNLKDNKFLTQIWTERFLNWSRSRFSGSGKEYDFRLDEVIYGLFPHADPHTLSSLLYFLFLGWVNDVRMETLIATGKGFGSVSHSITFINLSEEEQENKINDFVEGQRQEAYNIIYLLFPASFTKNKLQEYIHDLELVSPSDEAQELRKSSYLKIFTDLFEFLYSQK